MPLKFGHNGDQALTDGQPALGWVARVYREGDKLKADFTDMPTSIYEMVKAGLYKFVSVELLKNVQANTRTIPWVLDAVALLGADQPAVGTLKDLQSLTMKRKPALQARARVAFQRDTKFFTGANKAMDEKEVQAAIAAALEAQEKKLTTNFSKQLTEEVTKVQAAAKADADAQVAKAKAESHRALIKAKFESAVKAEALLPAKRESFFKFNRVDDDKSVIEIKLEDVDAYIEEFSDKAKLAAMKAPATKGGSDKVEFAATAALEVTRRAEELTLKRGGKVTDYAAMHEATKIVLSTDKKLATAYFADPSGAFKVEAA